MRRFLLQNIVMCLFKETTIITIDSIINSRWGNKGSLILLCTDEIEGTWNWVMSSSLDSLCTAVLGWKSKWAPDSDLAQHLQHHAEINFRTQHFALWYNPLENSNYILVILKYRNCTDLIEPLYLFCPGNINNDNNNNSNNNNKHI